MGLSRNIFRPTCHKIRRDVADPSKDRDSGLVMVARRLIYLSVINGAATAVSKRSVTIIFFFSFDLRSIAIMATINPRNPPLASVQIIIKTIKKRLKENAKYVINKTLYKKNKMH